MNLSRMEAVPLQPQSPKVITRNSFASSRPGLLAPIEDGCPWNPASFAPSEMEYSFSQPAKPPIKVKRPAVIDGGKGFCGIEFFLNLTNWVWHAVRKNIYWKTQAFHIIN